MSKYHPHGYQGRTPSKLLMSWWSIRPDQLPPFLSASILPIVVSAVDRGHCGLLNWSATSQLHTQWVTTYSYSFLSELVLTARAVSATFGVCIHISCIFVCAWYIFLRMQTICTISVIFFKNGNNVYQLSQVHIIWCLELDMHFDTSNKRELSFSISWNLAEPKKKY